MKTTDTIYNQHQENFEWLDKLFFYKDEITIMQKRLEEIAKKNSSKDVLAEVEHFQNQLIVQKNNIDTIKHEINQNETVLENNMDQDESKVNRTKVNDHTEEEERVNSFENFNELRKELNKFLLKWM